MFTQRIMRAASNFAQTKIQKSPIKMLQLFQNNNTSAKCLLGEHLSRCYEVRKPERSWTVLTTYMGSCCDASGKAVRLFKLQIQSMRKIMPENMLYQLQTTTEG